MNCVHTITDYSYNYNCDESCELPFVGVGPVGVGIPESVKKYIETIITTKQDS